MPTFITVVLVILIVVLVLFLAPLFTMWLWNWLMPEIFGLMLIDFWQALGLICLSSLLFRCNYNYKK